MEPHSDIKAGMVVQINPRTCENRAFAGCFMIVLATTEEGVEGYIQYVGADMESPGGQRHHRTTWREVDLVGKAPWTADIKSLLRQWKNFLSMLSPAMLKALNGKTTDA